MLLTHKPPSEDYMELFKPLPLSDGASLVRLARFIIEHELGLDTTEPNVPSYLRGLRLGVWVSIERIRLINGFRARVLRGNVGSPTPIMNLIDDVALIAKHAAFNSPNYGPISRSEVNRIVIEVTVNNQPRQVDLSNLSKLIVPGYHGLLVKRVDGSYEAYLPHKIIDIAEKLAMNNKGELTIDELVSEICSKGCEEVSIFETQSFYELEPRGEVIERMLYMNRYVRRINVERGIIPVTP